MSTRVIRRTRHPLETLERMLQKTTLTTQRLTHHNIMDIGSKLLTVTESDDREDRQKAIDDAVGAAEARATRELKAALTRMQQEKDAERQRALDKQKWYYDRQAQRVSDQRDKAEEERLKEERRRLTAEKEEALAAQREESLRQQKEAIDTACKELRAQLRQQMDRELKAGIAQAMKKAEEDFKKRAEEVRARTREECQEEARREAERTAKLHKDEVTRLTQRYKALDDRYRKESSHRERVETDFRGLQDDYKRFMDYTDGQFHSDYLMRLRHLGQALAEKRIVSLHHDSLPPLPQL